MKLSEAVLEFKRRFVLYALVEAHGDIKRAAKIIGQHPATMDRWVGILGLRAYARSLRYDYRSNLVRLLVFALARGIVFAAVTVHAATLALK